MDASFFLARCDLWNAFENDLGSLQETCLQQLSTLPPGLKRASETVIDRLTGHWQNLDWIYPFLLGPAWFVPQSATRQIALTSALITIHGKLQAENPIDTPLKRGQLCPLGSLLYTRALRLLQQHFAVDSHFWQLLEGYHLEWTEALLWQQQRQWGPVQKFSREDIQRLAGLRALLKVGCSAMALMAGKERYIMPLNSVMDQIHVAFQLIDGLINWREDLRTRQATYYLTEVALALNLRDMAHLSRMNLDTFLADNTLVDQVLKRALGHLTAARKVAGGLKTPTLEDHLDQLHTTLKAMGKPLSQWPAHTGVTPKRSPASALL
ncbi:MAG: hypothetical protein ACOYZ7_09250 [Chloroflexota bacterium]